MNAYLLRDDDGRILGGAGTDTDGRWTWWARVNGSRRVVAGGRGEAVAALHAACGVTR